MLIQRHLGKKGNILMLVIWKNIWKGLLMETNVKTTTNEVASGFWIDDVCQEFTLETIDV